MITERCIENLKRIITGRDTEDQLQAVAHDDLLVWFNTNRDRLIQISPDRIHVHKIKAMLWHLGSLKSDIRSMVESSLMTLLKKDGLMQPHEEQAASEYSGAETSVDEGANTAGNEAHAVAAVDDTKADMPLVHSRREDDWFDKLLDMVSAVVRGFTFNAV